MPMVMAEPFFALKGGTAINLFIRNLPRLSVDIDLTYLPVQDRNTSVAEIEAALLRIATRVETSIARVRVQSSRSRTDNVVTKLVVRVDNVQINIEVTPVLRGCVFDPEPRDVSSAVEDRFGFATARVVSFADLYAGKIVAALDRQHPRDLFDVRDLLANEVDERLRTAFVVYMISATRPLGEVLAQDPHRHRRRVSAQLRGHDRRGRAARGVARCARGDHRDHGRGYAGTPPALSARFQTRRARLGPAGSAACRRVARRPMKAAESANDLRGAARWPPGQP